ncbi:MAG: hypothetical protein EOP10_06445 [Proteobacteria bacterium]|nr:MAG: hypothetical protein EOP10_06445 [Pseudomonadota bacterium]
MKQSSRFITLCALSQILAYAAQARELKVTTQVEPSSSSDKLTLTATFDNFGFSKSDLKDGQHSGNGVYTLIKSKLAEFGKVESGFETGPNRTSIKVEVASINAEAVVAKTDADQPPVVKNLLRIHDLFEPVREELETKGTTDIGHSLKGVPFVQLNMPTMSEVHRFLLCVTVPYRAQIQNEMKIPLFLAGRIESECVVDASESYLENVTKLAEDKLLFSSERGVDVTHSTETWKPTNFDTYYQICRPGSLTQVDELIAAGWIKANSSQAEQFDQCQTYIQKNIVSRLRESITKGFSATVLGSKVNDYYKNLVKNLLDAKNVAYKISGKDYEVKLSKELNSLFEINNGFTQNELKAADFNLASFMAAVQQGETDPNTLLVKLMSKSETMANPMREELAKVSEKERTTYMLRMLAGLKKYCTGGALNPSCIYSGASRISESVFSFKLQSGLDAVNQRTGFYLEAPEKVLP